MLYLPLALSALLLPARAQCQLAPGSLAVRWQDGAADCARNPQPPLQVHAYNAQTFILRENLCATFEAPFMYLLIGSSRGLLIDTGDVPDPKQMPLANTVIQLLPGEGPAKVPLLVAHTHRHQDHRAGDGQLMHLPNVQVIGYDIDSVRRYYSFAHWPNDRAEIDLGGRIVDVIPTPGHNETEVSFYDRNTGLFFSGDFLLPGRLLIDDTGAARESAERVAAFVRDHPISYVLGGHIELDAQGKTFPWQSQHHPQEHVLQMSKDDLLALPAAIGTFNGFYTNTGRFILSNPIHTLIAMGIAICLLLIAVVLGVISYIRRRRRARKSAASLQQ